MQSRRIIAATLLLLLAATAAVAQGPTRISLDEAVELALQHSHALKAARTQIQQSQAQEITANLRPNPTLGGDALYFPLNASLFSSDFVNDAQQFDMGLQWLWERGGKRRWRLQAARDVTAVTRFQVADAERGLVFNVAQQFVNALLAESNLALAQQDLASFRQTVDIGEAQYKAGAISEGDFLKIKLQLLQFETDVSQAEVAKVQALAGLRQLVGYDALPADYDVAGDLEYQPLNLNQDDIKALALKNRPDLLAAQGGVTAAQSQVGLAKANGHVDVTTGLVYSHITGFSSMDMNFSVPLPIFDRNQGEIARTRFAVTQADETRIAAEDAVLTDVTNAWESYAVNRRVVDLYTQGYLKAAQDSRDISQYAYTRGAASLLDYLDAERSYRQTELAYRQALAQYILAVEQLKQAAGTRSLP
jgi:cobalt-zinc-cadmium efflux system outer membrane protein